MNKNKGFIGIGLILAIVLGIVVVGGGAYYLGKSKGENKKVNNQNLQPIDNSQETKNTDSNSSSTDIPLITSISPSSGPTGTTIELKGNNLAGFEGDLDAIIKNDKGETAFLKGIGLVPREDKTIRVKIEDKVCKQNNSYSGEPCTSWLNLIPGTYKIYTMPFGKKSNEVSFTINSANPISTLQLTGNDKGKTINSVKGQMIAVTLCNPGDSGAQFDIPKYDSSILKLTSHKNVPINTPTTIIGGCYGNDVFEFKTLKTGTSKLNITASQSWTGGDKLMPYFSATILVQ